MPANTDYQLSNPTRFGSVSLDTTGQSVSPALMFSSESSLGFYRSAASQIAQSYGTLNVSGLSATGGLRASTLSSTGTTIAPAVWTSGLSVGGASGFSGGPPVQAISYTSAAMPAMVVQGSASSFTILVWPAARVGGFFMTTTQGAGVSSVSSGLVFHSHCTQAGQIEVRISNVSTLVQNQSAQTLHVAQVAFF